MSLFYSLSLLGKFWQEKVNTTLIRWITFFIILQLVILFFTFSTLPSQVPLYYSLPWGEGRLAPVSNLFLFPLYSVLMFIINSVFAMIYSHKLKLLSQLLIISSLLFSLFSLFGLSRIIYLLIK